VTTIIGLQKPDQCLLVADSRITDDGGRTYTHPTVTKITKRGKYLIAGAGTTQVDDTLSVLMRDDGIYGIGSGAPYAIGALQAGATWRRAMQIAAKNNVFTAPPFITHKQTK